MAIQTSSTYPTGPQIQYALDLLTKKDLSQSSVIRNSAMRQRLSFEQEGCRLKNLLEQGKFTRQQCSAMISELQVLPDKPNTQPPVVRTDEWHPSIMPGTDDVWCMIKDDLMVPRGSYGLETPGSQFTNDITFFSVWINDDGSRWTVRMYVSDERVKISRTTQYAVLAAIAQNPAEAAECYGLHIGKCGICGRKLTNDESRARGIGPICASRFGW